MRFCFLAPMAACALTLTGCVSIGSGDDPPPQLITFTASEAAPAGATAAEDGDAFDSAILVFEPEVEDRLDVKRVPVKIDASSVAYLQDAYYVDRPARLFRSLLAETLRARTGRLIIEGPDPGPGMPNRTRLYGRLIEMGYDAQAMAVIVTYDAMRVSPEGEVRAQRFSHSITGIAPEAEAVSPALNEAANAVSVEVADWIAGQAPAEG